MRKKSSTSKAAVQPVSSPNPTPVSERPVSPLRERMLGLMSDDLEMRGFAAKTRASYLRSVARLAKYCGKSPETLSEEELRRSYRALYLAQRNWRTSDNGAETSVTFSSRSDDAAPRSAVRPSYSSCAQASPRILHHPQVLQMQTLF